MTFCIYCAQQQLCSDEPLKLFVLILLVKEAMLLQYLYGTITFLCTAKESFAEQVLKHIGGYPYTPVHCQL